jgi:hypothetical protein
MPRYNKNSAKDNSIQFELFATEEGGMDNNTVGSTSTTCAIPATRTWSALEAQAAIQPRATTTEEVGSRED